MYVSSFPVIKHTKRYKIIHPNNHLHSCPPCLINTVSDNSAPRKNVSFRMYIRKLLYAPP